MEIVTLNKERRGEQYDDQNRNYKIRNIIKEIHKNPPAMESFYYIQYRRDS